MFPFLFVLQATVLLTHIMLSKVKKKKIRFEATWAIIKHPSKELYYLILIYKRFHTATKYFPNSIYAMITKVEIDSNQEAKMQINPNEVNHVILSHFMQIM
ncbi:MAG: hypothetical protein CM15mP65_09990 [Crocinitomicaceae bacterium]|nr:MAG: hypothetical protein CM15mP65_09990 [Crocinitomicaceae bacterium]